ncbi:Nuclear RNA export factor, partial [Ooceraea biroi]
VIIDVLDRHPDLMLGGQQLATGISRCDLQVERRAGINDTRFLGNSELFTWIMRQGIDESSIGAGVAVSRPSQTHFLSHRSILPQKDLVVPFTLGKPRRIVVDILHGDIDGRLAVSKSVECSKSGLIGIVPTRVPLGSLSLTSSWTRVSTALLCIARPIVAALSCGNIGDLRGTNRCIREKTSPGRGGSDPPRAAPRETRVIPYGHKYGKDYVLRTLLAYIAPQVFVPITYKIMGNEASFFVDDFKTANALLNCNRKITMTDGFKLVVRVRPGFPQCEIDDKLKERLKQAMAKRYVQETNALDLSKFHHDPDLVADYFCALFRPAMLIAVLDIVAEHIPTLEALNLESNKLLGIERLNVLSKKFSRLKILYIGDNKINISYILFKDLKLEELRLTANPLCNKYKSRQNDYISDIRKRFPKLLRLDGMELPRPIVFDVVETAKVPPSQRMFVSNAKAQEIASQFLQQYFTIFDSESRQPLLDAYDEHACLSMTITTSHPNKLNGYLMENRNLFRMNDTVRRQKLLKQGRLSVVSFISELPRTRHFLNTFTMDITLATQTMMFVTITGYFQELTEGGGSNRGGEPIRYFNRTFIIVPEGSGYCIRNEQLHISQPFEAQLKQLNEQQLNSQQSQAETPALLVPAETAKPVTQSELSEDIKQQMTMTLSQQTNMNLEWSLKCLQETQWNYDNALFAFQEFYKRGQIPPEAFTK